jgi:beta-lactamase class A
METTKMAKQAINFQKTAFEKMFNATVMLQDQTEKMANSLMDQASWMPAESKKLINDWVVAYKKGRDDFKKSVDDNFKKTEDMFDVAV